MRRKTNHTTAPRVGLELAWLMVPAEPVLTAKLALPGILYEQSQRPHALHFNLRFNMEEEWGCSVPMGPTIIMTMRCDTWNSTSVPHQQQYLQNDAIEFNDSTFVEH